MSGSYRGQKSYWLSNHPPKQSDNNGLVSGVGDAKNIDGFFWRSHTQAGYLISNYYSANFLLDDGSAHRERKLNLDNTAVGVHVVTLPKSYFEEP